jgi:hypothetical protein
MTTMSERNASNFLDSRQMHKSMCRVSLESHDDIFVAYQYDHVYPIDRIYQRKTIVSFLFFSSSCLSFIDDIVCQRTFSNVLVSIVD